MDAQEELDDLNIERLLNFDPTSQNKLDFLTRELEPGEKADNAIDFEDIADDDLAEDEDDVLPPLKSPGAAASHDGKDTQEFLPPDTSSTAQDDCDLDDLFGGVPSSPVDQSHGLSDPPPPVSDDLEVALGLADEIPTGTDTQDFAATQVDRPLDSGPDHDFLLPPAPPENPEEALSAMWPKFRRDERPKFIDLLPPKKAHYLAKVPLKPPKSLQPNKISLDLEPDQEQIFKSYGPARPTRRELGIEAAQKGLILTLPRESEEDSADEQMELDDGVEGERIGNVTWDEIKMICEDWDAVLDRDISEPEANVPSPRSTDEDDFYGEFEAEMERALGAPATKRQKTGLSTFDANSVPRWNLPSFDDPERATAQLARRVVLDLNDPQLLVDIQQPSAASQKRSREGAGTTQTENSTVTARLLRRYNISNDEAYNLLKENHQNKVRGLLSEVVVDHSMPALRLQYPFYKVRLARHEARAFHRPLVDFTPDVEATFSPPAFVKRKHLKDKDPKAIFQTAKDLSLADNSSMMLLEYSEEYPTMLSNFGMGSRLTNYYRRKNKDDKARPKLDIGETTVLLPEDRGPFHPFGHVDPGETVPAVQNGMFRAPVFRQDAPHTDFLVIRSTTGADGARWCLRNIENLHVVGQQFPVTEVPGPHARKVTTVSKTRLKMIAYRKLRKNEDHRVSVAEITEHFPDSTDMQNRQKLKEFMQFNREHKEWEMRTGETIPDPEKIQSMIKPEDVCLLEASQVGLQHLQDAGYGKVENESDDEDGVPASGGGGGVGGGNKEGQSLEQELAPWNTTKNFAGASQGKAMVLLHGEGDPTGRGEAFSFIRTSMKGGFKALGESVEDKIDARKIKDSSGHSYNVQQQQKAYDDSIRRIWEAQKKSLSASEPPSYEDADEETTDAAEDLFDGAGAGAGRSGLDAPLPSATPLRGDDDGASQVSKFSIASQRGKVLRITRDVMKDGQVERLTEVVRDPRVIREYLRRRHAMEAESMTLSDLKPTGDAEQDKRARKRLEEELARLERNKDRRLARDKQKLNLQEAVAGSPASPGAGSPSAVNVKATGTLRKCANCGQVGHIKTNKKLCPMLNGTANSENQAGRNGAGGAGSPPAA